ncbi:hypothetical protein MOMA_05836 [Moraxella macacae 0408225]|uniref:MFS transporter n=1 Tax=Moraxella macacae 0408225 TaxID=1230338 RepID=L2F4Y2_9GAMM|nr:hypothetical protein [Moraxella macacae]ELA08057.1 hypothetical protein MOMA_05836 [Moraxella macacae 0408225]
MPDVNKKEAAFGVYVFIVVAVRIFLSAVMPIYAIVKDVQNDKIMWAVADFVLFFPIGTIRGLMYLFEL